MYVTSHNHRYYLPIVPPAPPLEIYLGCGNTLDLLPPQADQEDVETPSYDTDTDDDLDFDRKLDKIFHDNNDIGLTSSNGNISIIDSDTMDTRELIQHVNTTVPSNTDNNHDTITHIDIAQNNTNTYNQVSMNDNNNTNNDHADDTENDTEEDGKPPNDKTSNRSNTPYPHKKTRSPTCPPTPPTSSPRPENDTDTDSDTDTHDPKPPHRPALAPKKPLTTNPFSTGVLDFRRPPSPPRAESSSMAAKRKASDEKIDNEGRNTKAKKTGEKKSRTKVACQACRARKAKCSGGEICSRCKQFNLVCEYEEIRRRSPSPTSHRGKSNYTECISAKNVPKNMDGNENEPGPSSSPESSRTPRTPSNDTYSEEGSTSVTPHRPAQPQNGQEGGTGYLGIGPGGLVTPISWTRSLVDEEDEGEEGQRRFDREGKRKARDQ